MRLPGAGARASSGRIVTAGWRSVRVERLSLHQRHAGRKHVDRRDFRSEVLLKVREPSKTSAAATSSRSDFQHGFPLNESGFRTCRSARGVHRRPVGPRLVRCTRVSGSGRKLEPNPVVALPGKFSPRRNGIGIFHDGFVGTGSGQTHRPCERVFRRLSGVAYTRSPTSSNRVVCSSVDSSNQRRVCGPSSE